MIFTPPIAPPRDGVPCQAPPPPVPPILDAALAYHRADLCVLPAWPDQKRPILATWKQHIAKRPNETETAAMFRDADRLGHRLFIVCGHVSGGAECIDFDDSGSAFAAWRASVPAPVFERLAVEQSPSGGFHVVYRCPDASAPRTQTLARTEAGNKLIEMRGEGAGFVAHPSPGYRMVQGRFAALPVLSPGERDALLQAASVLNRCAPAPAMNAPATPSPPVPPAAGVAGPHPYAAKALIDECAAVVSAVEGSRNETLNVAAVKLGHYVGGGALPENLVRDELAKAALANGLEPAEVAATLASGLRKGMVEPKTIPDAAPAQSGVVGGVDMRPLLNNLSATPALSVPAIPSTPETLRNWRTSLMSLVDEQPVHWLWPNRLALGKLNMLIGDPGLGKSFITCDLAARISTGAPWPDGAASDGPGMVLLLNAEDDPADTIKPRLRAAHADMTMIASMPAVDNGRLFSLAKHIDALAYNAAQLPNLKLIVIDPVSAFLSGIDSHKNTDVREALAPLSALAEANGAAILAVTHLNKGAGQAVYRATGSLAFAAAARSVWAVAKDRNNRDRRLFLPVKNNLGNDKTGLAYAINGYSDPPFVEWNSEPVAIEADDALAPDAPRAAPSRASATATVDEWLAAFLEGGERPASEIHEAGKAAGFSESQLLRARPRVGAELRKAGFPPKSYWRLPGHEPDAVPGAVPPVSGNMPSMPNTRLTPGTDAVSVSVAVPDTEPPVSGRVPSTPDTRSTQGTGQPVASAPSRLKAFPFV